MIKTYFGSCHCGRVRFEVDANIDHVRVCDCSICSKRAALIHRVSKDRLRLLTPWDDLSVYQWGSHTAKDFFCPNCGILPFRRPSDPTAQELLEGVKRFDGWAISAVPGRHRLFHVTDSNNLREPDLRYERMNALKGDNHAL